MVPMFHHQGYLFNDIVQNASGRLMAQNPTWRLVSQAKPSDLPAVADYLADCVEGDHAHVKLKALFVIKTLAYRIPPFQQAMQAKLMVRLQRFGDEPYRLVREAADGALEALAGNEFYHEEYRLLSQRIVGFGNYEPPEAGIKSAWNRCWECGVAKVMGEMGSRRVAQRMASVVDLSQCWTARLMVPIPSPAELEASFVEWVVVWGGIGDVDSDRGMGIAEASAEQEECEEETGWDDLVCTQQLAVGSTLISHDVQMDSVLTGFHWRQESTWAGDAAVGDFPIVAMELPPHAVLFDASTWQQWDAMEAASKEAYRSEEGEAPEVLKHRKFTAEMLSNPLWFPWESLIGIPHSDVAAVLALQASAFLIRDGLCWLAAALLLQNGELLATTVFVHNSFKPIQFRSMETSASLRAKSWEELRRLEPGFAEAMARRASSHWGRTEEAEAAKPKPIIGARRIAGRQIPGGWTSASFLAGLEGREGGGLCHYPEFQSVLARLEDFASPGNTSYDLVSLGYAAVQEVYEEEVVEADEDESVLAGNLYKGSERALAE
ncbi:hypothetical protein AK812_SmicGene30102 [Symbiodinium microadriaticum]|uniref:Uncharacterized protein n=1 Tax=Symbiodinium microadriaticum TaxID=2951 RepID=A0A1Q9D063_SYMMI|nr:hypothetical protein AK812_SmicGene30102 [Symbiodinium microadriaticum]